MDEDKITGLSGFENLTIPERPLVGCLLGTAVGDAFGLPFENLSRRRARRMFGNTDNYHFLFGKGMVSDDTEHACMTAQALIFSGGEPEKFIRKLSRELRFWLLGLPAGVGYATLRAVLKLWIGFSGENSGVFSAGNGPAVRSPLIGICFGQDKDKMRELVRCSTRITHSDPKAEIGALAVALGAHMAVRQKEVSPICYYDKLQDILVEEDAHEFLTYMERIIVSIGKGETTESFAASLTASEGAAPSQGVSGYMYHTVPAVIHCWLRHQRDFRGAVTEIVRCGGDTDTTAAIVGGITGAAAGPEGIPRDWLTSLWEWPRTKQWIRELGHQLAEVCESGSPRIPVDVPFHSVLMRNVLFLTVVLFHGLRRLLPPY